MKTKAPKSYEVNKRIRRDWGEIRPVTKIIPDKRRVKRDRIDRREKENY